MDLRSGVSAAVLAALVCAGCSKTDKPTESPVNSANAKAIMLGVFSKQGMTIAEAEGILGPGQELSPDSEFLSAAEKHQSGRRFKVWEKRKGAGKNGEHIRVAYLPQSGKIVSVSPNVNGFDLEATAPGK
jgi:hypothetical protein